ncbi:connectin-like [Odontomachus brunneus]|uniref:connectin-like n=1 Tax=Odontomachus brunneus TaxID=486640 RepID=UPI0013F1C916|nr:connectin-like [Odontomachus brunneus]XP_032679984.1 connectin-like [Odontomachus brunneus]XP_032679985.1 connectin-like [Odontomachus brunneus]
MRRFLRLLALQLLLLMILLACCDLTSSTRSRNRKKLKTNLCHIKDQKAPINCNCLYHGNVTEIDCWVVKPLSRDDPFWAHFSSQHMEKLLLKQHENGILDYVPAHVLHQMKNLRVFELLYVQMSELPEYSFVNITGLSELRVTDGKIVKLHDYSFVNMRNLTILDLGRNNISEITRETFVELPVLRTLYLDRNLISTVRDKAFKQLTSLQKLVLSRNKINNIVRDCFQGLRNLQHLDLRNNALTIIGDRSFVDTPELQVLELDDNHIKIIAGHAFSGLHKLRKLYLSGNRLIKLEPQVLDSIPSVSFLDLRRNFLETLTFESIKPIVFNLYNANSSFYLDDNKLSCDCKLNWTWGLRNETVNVRTKLLLERLVCYYEINNATEKIYGEGIDRNLALERNQPLEIVQNPEENNGDNSRYNDGEEDGNRDEEDRENYEEVELEIPPLQNVNVKADCNGKVCYVKRLFDLKMEELPCPKSSREDLMASEQPSSHPEKNIRSDLSNWFSSSAQAVRSVLAASLLPLLFILFT